jgi:transcriptional regulator with XRE-family HTH domain
VEDLRVACGKRVRELRKDLGFSQEALAERARLHWTYISGVELGLKTPSLDVVGRIAAALRISPSELFSPLTGKEFEWQADGVGVNRTFMDMGVRT